LKDILNPFLKANVMMRQQIRLPAVAGMFYPAETAALNAMLHDFFCHTKPSTATAPKAMIVPHAGYIYSGAVAATAYSLLHSVRDQIKRVVLLGPSHRVALHGLAASSARAFVTPLGEVMLDQDNLHLALSLPHVHLNDHAHAQEHSLEVHLPFLQTVLADFRLLPLVVGTASAADVAAVLQHVCGGAETLIIISSDLSHYLDYATAQALDQKTTVAIEHLRYQDIRPDHACGAFPLNGLLYLAQQLEMQAKNIDLRNSGDTAGSKDRVVGYGAYVFH
jgi:MEMO1 family protein